MACGIATPRPKAKDERLPLVTVTHVEVEPDMRHAIVLLSSLDEETEAALRAMGVKPPTGRPDPNFQPLPQRPAWLAFLLRLVRYREE